MEKVQGSILRFGYAACKHTQRWVNLGFACLAELCVMCTAGLYCGLNQVGSKGR